MSAGAATITLRDARPDDADLLRDLFAGSRPDLALLPAPTRDLMLDLQYRAQTQHYATAHPGAQHRIIEVAGIAAGRILLDVTPDAVHIVDITVDEQQRGRGIGSVVLESVLTDAQATGRRVTLAVWSANLGALRLYTRLGFVCVPDTDDTASDDTGYVQLRRDPNQEGE